MKKDKDLKLKVKNGKIELDMPGAVEENPPEDANLTDTVEFKVYDKNPTWICIRGRCWKIG